MVYNLRKRQRPEPEVPRVVKTKKPKVVAPKVKAPKVEPKVKVPKVESKVEAPKVEPDVEVPKDEPVVEAPKVSEAPGRSLFAFGADSCGELGQGKIGFSKKIPVKISLPEPVKATCCGPMHTVALTMDGKVYTFGCNDEGALGRETDGDELLESTPTTVKIQNPVIKVTAGDSHTAVLTDKNEVYIWGNFRDEHGSVGLIPSCDGKPSFQPIRLLEDTKFKDIASGSNHMLLLDVDGAVYSFGVGAQGQLGRLKPEEINHDGNTISITAENREIFLTPKEISFKAVDPQRTFVCDAVYAGNFSSFATNTDKKKNRLAGWGLNNYHQLGYKGKSGELVQYFPKRSTFTCSTSMIGLACGPHHTLFLTKTGRVYSAGRHDYGMLGLGKVDKEVCPAKHVDTLTAPVTMLSAGINTSFAVDQDGKLYSWGMGGKNLGHQDEEDLKAPLQVKSLDDKRVISVSAGGSFTSIVSV